MSDPSPQPLTVWQIYKSRFLYTQAFILFACVAIYLYRKNLPLTLSVFCFLQLSAVYGSWMGKRMVDQIIERERRE